MYEQGDGSAVEALISSKDFSDLVNKAEYVQNVHDYDRQKLAEYVATKEQVAELKTSLEEEQKALEEKEFTATAGGGAVEVTISGKREVTKVKLQEEVVDPDDIEMLEDLIVAATNEALRKVEEESTAVMSKLTGGLGGLGGGLPF